MGKGVGKPMRCAIIGALLTRYHDGELPGFLAKAVAGHLEGCLKCRKALEGMDKADGLVREMRDVEVPDGIWDGVASDIGAYERARTKQAPHIILKPAPRMGALSYLIFSNKRPVYAFARGAIALLLVLSLTFAVLPDRSVAQAVEVSGVVLVAGPGQDNWKSLTRDTRIYEGTKLRFTHDKDFVDLKLAKSDEVIRLKKVPSVSAKTRTIKVMITKGRIRIRPNRPDKATTFRVWSPARVVEVGGDVCVINVTKGEGGTSVSVEEM